VHRTSAVCVSLAVFLGLLVTGCNPTPTPLDMFEAAVRTEIETQITNFSGAGLRNHEVLTSRLQGDGNYGHLEARIVLEACPHFYYDVVYNGEFKDGRWILYNDRETFPNLFKRWATAHSAALAGQMVNVPGSGDQRQVYFITEAMVDLLRAREEGLSNLAVDSLVGFFLCEKENILWGELDEEVSAALQELMPRVEKLMDEELARHFAPPQD